MTTLLDRCRFKPSGSGTSDFTFASAVTGFNSPDQAGAVNGGVYKYAAENSNLSLWEIGQGTYNSTTKVLTRTTVLYNSSATGTASGQSGAGSKINFVSSPQVMLVALAEDISPDALVMTGTLTGNFWSIDTPPARIQRVTDRMLVGGAVAQDGSRGGGSHVLSWVSPEASGEFTYFDTRSQMEIISTIGGVGLAVALRTSDNNPANTNAPIGIAVLAKNDLTDAVKANRRSAWGMYVVAARVADDGTTISGSAQVIETEIANMGSVIDTNPYGTLTSLDGVSYGCILGSGAEYANAAPGTVNSASAALHIANVGATFRKGINFSANSIDGCNGTTGTGIAMSFAKGHELHWYYSGGAGADSFSIRSDNTTASAQTKIVATATGLRFYDQWENTVFRINPLNVASGVNVNYCLINNAQSGSGTPSPSFQTTGSDVNVGLNMIVAGKGVYNWYNSGAPTRTIFRVTDAGSLTTASVNTLAINAQDAGTNPYIAAIGSDTNVDVRTVGKGTGGLVVQDGAAGVKFQANTTGIGFYGTTPAAKPTITGSRGGNAALASLLTSLATLGLIVDSTSA